jgi:hypothetical protein
MTPFWLRINIILFVSLFVVGPGVLAQQATCPEIVQAALDATDEQCSAAGRNEVCYGNVNLEATPQPGIEEFNFATPGDLVEVSAVESLSLSSRVEEAGEWGIALMQLQTNLPDSLPGQNVTFLLFGDVQITNGVETNVDPITIDVTAQGNINVRSGPSADRERMAGLSGGETVTAIGRNAASTWLQVSLADGSTGWVSAEVVSVDDDISLLNVIDPAALPLTPMQAFYFQSGIGDAPCAGAPDSGILVQTPEGVGEIQFTVNEVNITLGSTAYLQAQAGVEMTASVVEGQATVTAGGATVVAPAGTRVRIPITVDLRASGAPVGPEPYRDADLAALPVDSLAREIAVAPALTEEEIEALFGLVPLPGTWQVNSFSTDCPGWPEVPSGTEFTLTVQDGGATITIGTQSYSLIEPGVYGLIVPAANGFTTNNLTLTFLSPVSATYLNDLRDYGVTVCMVEENMTRTGD